jgi:GMP reductase
MKIINDLKLDFQDVLIRPQRSTLSSRSDVDLIREFTFPHSPRNLSCVPIFAANMDTTGTISMSNTLSEYNSLTCLHKHYDSAKLIEHFVNFKSHCFYSMGISQQDEEKMDKVFSVLQKRCPSGVPNICLDVANGYSETFVRFVSKLRNKYPDIIIMAGNVVTPEMTEELILHGGVDIVKVGIGPGSVCTTRLKTGVGYPQLSAILECSDAAHGLGGHICSDGGCKTPADVCKAFGANSDFVMLGGMFAGTDCCEGDWEYEYLCKTVDQKGNFIREWWQANPPGYHTEKRKKSLKFYGMSSKEAMTKHNGGVADYRTSEGKCVTIPYKGKTEYIIKDVLGGLRSCCTYVGASNLKSLPKRTTFIRTNDTHNRIFE